MKLILLPVTLVALLEAHSFKMRIRSSSSLQTRMALNGQYRQHLGEQQLRKWSASSNYTDEFFVGAIEVGIPAQKVNVLLDTSSANLWVIDDACASDACNGTYHGHSKHKFRTSESKTFRKEDRPFAMATCEGYLATDVVSFAGLTVPQQEFGVATGIAPFYGDQPVDGVFGLGWPELAVEKVYMIVSEGAFGNKKDFKVVPPMQNVLPQLNQPMFTVWLDKRKPSGGEDDGMIVFGDFDFVHCDSSVNYAELVSLAYWQFAIDAFSVGSFSQKKNEQVISDTSFPWIGAPFTLMKSIAKEVKAQHDLKSGLYHVPCAEKETLPDMVFSINGVKHPMPSDEYVLDLGNDNCVLTFVNYDGGNTEPSWIFGSPFMRTYCHVYDIGGKRIGFAKAEH